MVDRDLATFQRFVERCAGRTGRLLNHSSLAPWNRLHEHGMGR